jgi:hypothetical protein
MRCDIIATGILEALNVLGKYDPHLSIPSCFFFLCFYPSSLLPHSICFLRILILLIFLNSFLFPSFRCNKANRSTHARHERKGSERAPRCTYRTYCDVLYLLYCIVLFLSPSLPLSLFHPFSIPLSPFFPPSYPPFNLFTSSPHHSLISYHPILYRT